MFFLIFVVIFHPNQVDKSGMTSKIGSTGEKFWIAQPIKVEEVRKSLQEVFDSGIKSLAIVLVHSYAFNDHELQIEKIAQEIGFVDIATSHQVMPMVKMVLRGNTTVVDAYLTPSIKTYVKNFQSGFKDHKGLQAKLLFMRSDGGLTPIASFFGSRAVLSGPAGGVLGYANATYDRQRIFL